MKPPCCKCSNCSVSSTMKLGDIVLHTVNCSVFHAPLQIPDTNATFDCRYFDKK
jgi:hypothetical protein